MNGKIPSYLFRVGLVSYSLFVGHYVVKKHTLLGQEHTSANVQVVPSEKIPKNTPTNTEILASSSTLTTQGQSTSTPKSSDAFVTSSPMADNSLLETKPFVNKEEGFSIRLPKDCLLTGKAWDNGLVELCRIAKSTDHASAITVAKVSTTLDENTILTTPVSNLHLKMNVEIKKDYVVSVGGKKIRAIETLRRVTRSSGESVEYWDLNFFFIKDYGTYREQYVVDTISPILYVDEYKSELESSLSTFTLN